jgi:hypothetical protein
MVLSLSDPVGAAVLGAGRAVPPGAPPGRAVLVPGDVDVQCLHAAPDGLAALAAKASLGSTTTRHDGCAAPMRVRALGEVVRIDDLPRGSWSASSGWVLPLGFDPKLQPVTWRLAPGMHALVAGPPRSGRTSAVRLVALQALAAASDVAGTPAVLVVGAPADGQPWPCGAEVIDPWRPDAAGAVAAAVERGQPALVVVDDADLLPVDVATALQRAAERTRRDLAFVAAGRPEGLRSITSWAAPLRASRTGLLLHPQPGDSDVLRVAATVAAPLARRRAGSQPPGRGLAVSPSVSAPVQVAWSGA